MLHFHFPTSSRRAAVEKVGRVSAGAFPALDVAGRSFHSGAAAYTKSLGILRALVSDRALRRHVEARDFLMIEEELLGEDKVGAALTGRGVAARDNSFWDVLWRTMQASAKAELERLESVPVAKADTVGVEIQFDFINPEAVAAIEGSRFAMITNVSAGTRAGIRESILTGYEEGLHPSVLARSLKNDIGLTKPQARALANYRRALTSGNFTGALSQDLRDHRFDTTLNRLRRVGGKLDAGKADKIVDRYRKRLLQHRANTIARTELNRAAHAGQQEVWRQAQTQGLLPKDARKVWFTNDPCPLCAPIPGMNPNGVGLTEAFDTLTGSLLHPPVHPNCMCGIGTKRVKGERPKA